MCARPTLGAEGTAVSEMVLPSLGGHSDKVKRQDAQPGASTQDGREALG